MTAESLSGDDSLPPPVPLPLRLGPRTRRVRRSRAGWRNGTR